MRTICICKSILEKNFNFYFCYFNPLQFRGWKEGLFFVELENKNIDFLLGETNEKNKPTTTKKPLRKNFLAFPPFFSIPFFFIFFDI